MKLAAFIFEHPWYIVNDYLTIVGCATRVIFCCSMSLLKVMKLDAFIFEHPWYMVNDYLTIVGYATRVIFCCSMFL